MRTSSPWDSMIISGNQGRGRRRQVKQRVARKIGLLLAILFLLNGCLPGIYVSRNEPTAQGHPVEFRLGNPVEVGEWLSLQKQVCGDLDAATEGLPEDARRDIYRH